MTSIDKHKLSIYGAEDNRRCSVQTVSDAGSDVEMKRKMHGKKLTAAWTMFSDYTDNSTIHGVKYLGEKRRHWSERAFWVMAFIISVTGCFILIVKIYEKWQNTPVIVSFAEKSTPVWQIPFPAVTICPETKAMKKHIDLTKGYIYTKVGLLDNLTSEELTNLDAVSQICDLHLFDQYQLNSGLQPEDIVPLLRSITVSLNETTLFCKWRNAITECTDIFTEIITEEGFCYTFNVLNATELFKDEALESDFSYLRHNQTSTNWTLEKGYETADSTTYPFRVLGPGARAGLNIVLKLTDVDLDYMCRGPVQGFKILLHTPGEIPRVSKQYFRVPLRQEVVVSVKPNMITTSDGLIGYAPDRRQCYFNDERQLRFFKVYTQSNCELECLANFTLAKCGCVKFSMPRDTKMKICGQRDVPCYDSAEDLLMMSELSQSLETKTGENKRGKTTCNCLPSCTSINYDAEISQADYEYVKVFEAHGGDLNEYPGLILARLTIFFKENQFITSKRSELYGLTDFMANVGGLLGLFMGVSILSLIEILYYITLRLACHLNYRRHKKLKARRNSSVPPALSPNIDFIPGIKVEKYNIDSKND